MHIVVEPLLEHSTAQVICLPLHSLTYRHTQLDIVNVCLPCGLRKPRRFEYAR